MIRLRYIMIALCCVLIMENAFSVHAATGDFYSENESEYESRYVLAPPEEDAIVINSDSFYEDGRRITTTTYQMSDGSIITDTINEGVNGNRSSEGSDVVTRSKTVNGWGTLTIIAAFDWYTEIPFSYVRCSYMYSYFTPSPGVIYGDITNSYTSDYVAIGKASANARVTLTGHFPELAVYLMELTIECSDSGTISDH